MNTLRSTMFSTGLLLILPVVVCAGEEQAKAQLDVPALTEKLKHKDDFVRQGALTALGRAGKDPLESESLKATLPDMAATVIVLMIAKDRRAVQPVHLDAEIAIIFRQEGQLKVVRH